MDQGYEDWLRLQGYDDNTVNAQLYRAGRVEQYYGDFDQHFEADGLLSVVEAFVYTIEDAKLNKPNPTLIPYKGGVHSNMNGYKFAVRLYGRYRQEMAVSNGEETVSADRPSLVSRRSPRVGSSTPKTTISQIENPITLEHFGIDGLASLQALIASSRYKSLAQAMASLTYSAIRERSVRPKARRFSGRSADLGRRGSSRR